MAIYIFRSFNKKSGKPHPRWRFCLVGRHGVRKKYTGFASKARTRRVAERVQREEGL
jgi:hypothetical protein